MKKLMKKFGGLVMVSALVAPTLMMFPVTIFAGETEVDREVVIKSYQPTNDEEAWRVLEDVNGIESGYWLDLMNVDTVCNETYTLCSVEKQNPENGELLAVETWAFEYEYDADVKEAIDDFVSKLPAGKTKFALTEYDYLNYLIYSSGKNLSMASFSSELKKVINYKNFFLDVRMGSGGGLYTAMGGMAKFYYDGTLYNVIPENYFAYYNHVFYLENNVTDVMLAMENKIKAIFPNVEVTITDEETTVGEMLYDEYYDFYESPWSPSEEKEGYESADEYALAKIAEISADETHDYYVYADYLENNVYTVTIDMEGLEAPISTLFVPIKDSSKVVDPKHITSDLKTDVTISTENGIPFDTMIKVSKLTSGTEYNKIMDILKLSSSETFDLKLFAQSVEDYITKLDDGTFEVKIPIAQQFRNKKLVVYYVGEDNKVQEYKVTVDGDYAVFTTDHFSAYTLAEAPADEENPDTSDNLVLNIIIGTVSLVGTIGCGLYLKKKRIN